MQQGLDGFAMVLQDALHRSAERRDHRQSVLDALSEQQTQIRDLEMVLSHYRVQAQQMVLQSAQSPDLHIRLRSAGAAVAYQDVINDLERRLAGLKQAQKNLVLRLDI